ncbi:MAG: lasso peptide biosynthesis B2 protein [Lachnospiraceae bacterium]|nr:lasso peptide biosynthesis B2 protein [Lachnospiraceae bacterium]
MFGRIYRFIRYNEHKTLTLKAWMYSAIYRFQILHKKSKKLNAKWGAEGEESPEEATLQEYRYAKKVAYAVNQVCNKTRWESKCLVRALTAQRLLRKKKIETTLYLGCGLEKDGTMIAHAWLRCGRLFVTGGDGQGYAVVDKFRA